MQLLKLSMFMEGGPMVGTQIVAELTPFDSIYGVRVAEETAFATARSRRVKIYLTPEWNKEAATFRKLYSRWLEGGALVRILGTGNSHTLSSTRKATLEEEHLIKMLYKRAESQASIVYAAKHQPLEQ